MSPLTLLNLLAAFIILIESLCLLNKMSVHTSHHVRLAYLFISLGAAYTLLNPQVLNIPPLLMNIAVAYLLWTPPVRFFKTFLSR